MLNRNGVLMTRQLNALEKEKLTELFNTKSNNT